MTTERDQMEEGENICRNPACDCAVPVGHDFCGDYCRSAAVDKGSGYADQHYLEHGTGCGCGHAECQV